MTNPYVPGSVKYREYAAGFACGMGNAYANFKSSGSPNWSVAYTKGYDDGFAYQSSRGA